MRTKLGTTIPGTGRTISGNAGRVVFNPGNIHGIIPRIGRYRFVDDGWQLVPVISS
jgi:hypothetical protein